MIVGWMMLNNTARTDCKGTSNLAQENTENSCSSRGKNKVLQIRRNCGWRSTDRHRSWTITEKRKHHMTKHVKPKKRIKENVSCPDALPASNKTGAPAKSNSGVSASQHQRAGLRVRVRASGGLAERLARRRHREIPHISCFPVVLSVAVEEVAFVLRDLQWDKCFHRHVAFVVCWVLWHLHFPSKHTRAGITYVLSLSHIL